MGKVLRCPVNLHDGDGADNSHDQVLNLTAAAEILMSRKL
jgi:hypothetical protein